MPFSDLFNVDKQASCPGSFNFRKDGAETSPAHILWRISLQQSECPDSHFMCPHDYVVSLSLSDVFQRVLTKFCPKTRSFQVLVAPLSVPASLPAFHHVFNHYMVLDVNWASILMVSYLAYYLALEPTAAVSCLPSHRRACLIPVSVLAAALRSSANRVHANCNCLCA